MARLGSRGFGRLAWRDAVYALALWSVSVFLVFLFWTLSLATADGRGEPVTIWGLHLEQPALWLLDLAPFAVSFVYLFVMDWLRSRVNALEEDLAVQREMRVHNAEFAKAIGEGNYDVDFVVKNEHDRLGLSLLSMRDNLRETNLKEAEANWVTKGKDELANVLRLHNNLQELGYAVLQKLIAYIGVVQGGLYLYDEKTQQLTGLATYAYDRDKLNRQSFGLGEGLVGQCAFERAQIYRTEIPEDYMTIRSGILGAAHPQSLLLVPLITDEKLQGVLEFASLSPGFSKREQRFLEEVGETIARTLFNLRNTQETERLLRESQKLTREQERNERKLKENAVEMEKAQRELEESNGQLEAKIREAENAQKRLHSLLENASEVITIYGTDREISYISPSVTKILGYTPEEMESGKDKERLTLQARDALNGMFDTLMERPRESVTIQYVFLKRDGEKVWLEVTGRNMIKDPAVRGLILNARDITERIRAEKEERMKSKMQSLSENSVDVIVRMGEDRVFYYANPMVAEYLGLRPEEMVNRQLDDLALPEVLHLALEEMLAEIKARPERRERDVELGTQGGAKILHLMAIPEFDGEQLETILFVGHDITEARQKEKEIEEKNRKIAESINYAYRIQSSILPDVELLREAFPKSFMYYQPRDVVSGDFPWFFRKDDYIYVAAVDCTGHGVPGALLSFIGYFTLNNVVDHDASYSAGEILDHLHAGVRTTLRQDRAGADARDGMDIALCKINPKTMELEYAGAHRPLYFLRGGELTEYKGDRRAIGGIPNPRKPEGPFSNHAIALRPGDRVFFFSDGLPDQLGGERGMKKYSPQRIRQVLSEQSAQPMEALGSFIREDFERHLGGYMRIDDVILIGIEF